MDNAIEIKYDGLKNITYECLKRGVIYAEIGSDKSDLIMDIVPNRHYEGKTLNGDAKIGFVISIKSDLGAAKPGPNEKIVFDIDGERLGVEVGIEYSSKYRNSTFEEECSYSLEEIIGINGYKIDGRSDFDKVVFDIQPKDIKRIAEAKNACIYFDSNGEYNANGGSIALRNGLGSCQIEGIQGAMKRAYHYFVDETYYAEYCASFLETKQKILEEEKQKAEEGERIKKQQKIQEEREQRESEIQWRKSRNRTLIILVVSLVFIGTDWNTFFLVLGMVGGLYSIIKLGLLYHIDEWDGSGFN